MQQQISWLLGGALALTTLGCGLIQAAVQANEADRLEELEAKGDYEALAKTCGEPQRYEACKAMHRVARTRLAASTCPALVENTIKYYDNGEATQADDVELVKKYDSCKLTHVLFSRDLEVRWLSEAWTQVDKGGADVFAQLVAYLEGADHAFAGEVGDRPARNVAEWLVNVGDASRCAPVYAQVGHVAPEAHGHMLWFFEEVDCADQALPLALEQLSAEGPGQRELACEVLGKYGDSSVLDKLETLAETDPAKQEREVRTESGVLGVEIFYPVRERCLEAVGKVRLRN